MEETHPPGTAESPQGGELSREKLIQKCKNLLTIAQKAKIARDEAIEERAKLLEELENAKKTINQKDQQYTNVEEIMRVLTEQKLKLAMEIDSMKKEKTMFMDQIRSVSSEKETFEVEAESFKRQYNRLLSENEDLIGELQLRERSESQLLNDIKKLQENNESVRVLCTNVTQEKLLLEEELGKVSGQMELWNQTLAAKMRVDRVELKDLVSFIDRLSGQTSDGEGKASLNPDDISGLLEASQKENEALQQQVTAMKDKIQRLKADLEVTNVDRDQMANNLEEMRVETKTLIENVEKLNEEVDAVKEEKNKAEGVLNKILDTKNEEIDNLLKELAKNKAYVQELLANVKEHMESNKYGELNSKYLERSEELMMCKQEIEELRKKPNETKAVQGTAAVGSNVLSILKEGIVSNLVDLADTMPEYSKEFLNKLNAMLQGTDLRGDEGADIFVHYFNECLSQLKISLKENDILSKEVEHLKNSVRELENLAANHNKDCEQLRTELEELSADSSRLLLDLSHLRQENSIRVTEIDELMVRLRLKDEETDRLKENINRLELESSSQISELMAKLTDSNNNVDLLEQRNKELEGKCQSLLESTQNASTEELSELRQELDTAKMSIVALQQELERANSVLAEKTQEYENLKLSYGGDECSREDLAAERQLNSKLQAQLEELSRQLAENEALLSGYEELKDRLVKSQDSAGQLNEELNSICAELRGKTTELEISQKAVEVMRAEVNSLKTKCDEKDSEVQRFVGLLGEKETQYQENIEKLQIELKKVSGELLKTKKQLEESRTVKKEVEDLGKALKHQNSELEKAQRVLQEKANIEKELSQLKAIQQKTMEELETTKQRLDDSQLARKNSSELERSLKNKSSELEKTLWLLEERTAEKLAVSEELDKVKEELKNRVQELELAQNEGESVKHGAQEMCSSFERVSKELEAARQDLRRKVELEEELARLKEALDKSVKEVDQAQKDCEWANAKAQKLSMELESITEELENTHKKLHDGQQLEEELKTLKLKCDETASELRKSVELAKEGQSAKDEAQKLAMDLGRITQELQIARSELQNKEQLEVEASTLRDNLAQVMKESEELKKQAGAAEIAHSDSQKLVAEVERMSKEIERAKNDLDHKAELEKELAAAKNELQRTGDEMENLKRLVKDGEAVKDSLEKALVEKEAELSDALQRLSSIGEAKRLLNDQKEELVTKLAEVEKNFSLQNDGVVPELERRVEALQKECADLKVTAVEGAKDVETVREENARLLETVECLQAENKVFGDKLLNQGRAFNDELKKKNEEIQKLSKEIEESKEMVNFRKMELEDINCIWAGRLNSLKVNMITLGRSLNELSRQSKELQHMFLDKLHSLNTVITVNTGSVVDLAVAEAKKELLDEMHRMNEVLKDRGEAIAKLQDTLSETEGQMESVTSQNGELVNERSKLMADLKTKEEKLVASETVLKELEAEVGRLRDLKEGAHESDVLSTSTISRTEDHMRLKEVDDSIEEKYIKLRQIAVKLKKRVAELTQALEQSKNGPDKDLQEKIQHLSAVAKNAQKVQESYDKTLDELEESRKQNASMTVTVKELRSANESLKSQVTALQSQSANIPLMQKQIESLNATIKELKAGMNKLDMEKKVEVMKYEETKKQCTNLEAKVGNLSQSLDQAVQQGRSHNVLELEMKNYEKVIADLTSQLNSEKKILTNSEKELASIALVKSGLEEQIALLDKQVKAEESRNANLQGQLASMKETMIANQRQVDEVNSQLSEVKKEMHHAKSLSEQQALEMSSLTSEFSRKELDLQSKIDSFTAHIQSLETSLATTRQELSTSNSEKEHLREEFDNYRLRAQSMLARQKGDTVSQGEKEAREHLDKLKKELDGAREKMENTQTEIETLNNKLSSLQLEKARSDKRYEDITKALHQKITDYDTLNTEYRAFKFSAETLLQNTKLEFEERERAHNDEISRLKDLVDALNEQAVLKTQRVEDARNNDSAVPFEGHHLPDNLPSLQEREDGEGSESVPPTMGNFRRLSNLVPLDILLNNPIDDENRIPVLQEQIEKLHSELNSYDVRVKHLASLLSEAEKDSARSSQQNAVLKEELRRLERSLQREPHIANSEYLKNVIFKFLVLQSGDERTRLVPVLDTILKLSPEETSRLNAVAKGDSASWGSYLHSWTGL